MTDDGDKANIVGMVWDDDINDVFYETQICNEIFKYPKELLQPYKEETMEEIIKIDIPKGYEFAGFDDDKQQVVFEKIVCQYPKDFKECCEVLSLGENGKLYTKGYKASLIQDFHKLIICRNSYWKMAGEQMGLGKPWEPDWDDENEFKYGLYHFRNGIMRDGSCINSTLLAFPTEEMRDAFYENFKELINETKELL